MPDESIHQRFSSRLGLLLSVLGISIGTGNIWRFPRIAALNGGDGGSGAFLAAWVVCLFLWSVPLIVAEYALGRRTRMGVIGAFVRSAGERFAWMGGFVAFVTAAITFYYAVVVGWCLFYFLHTLWNPLPGTPEAALATWESFQASPWPMLFHAVVMVAGGAVAWRGIRSIERANKLLMPLLLATVFVALARALTLPGSGAGLAYLFTPEWSQLANPRVWLEALTQNAWDTGAGWGLFLTYAAHMQRSERITRNALFTGVGNNAVSLIAGMMVFGTLFAILQHQAGVSRPEVLEIARTSGPASTGLTLIWMPQLFAQMGFGKPLAVLFFLGLALAGFTSLIAHLELEFRVLVDFGWSRARAIVVALGVGYVLGIPSALNVDFLSNQDFVWSVALMLAGAFVAFAVLRYGAARLASEELDGSRLGPVWILVLRFFIPAGAAVLLLWWLWISADVGDAVGCLVQWAVVGGLLLFLNRRMAARVG